MPTNVMRLYIGRYFAEGVWVFIGQIVGMFGALVLVRVTTEILEPVQFAKLSLCLTAASLVNQLLFGGLAQGIARYYGFALSSKNMYSYMIDTYKMSAIAIVFVCVLAIPIFLIALNSPYSQWVLLISLVLFLSCITGVNYILTLVQNAARNRATVAFHNGLEPLLKIGILLIVVSKLYSSPELVVFSYNIAAILVLISQWYFFRKLLRSKIEIERTNQSYTKDILIYSWPFSAWGLFTWMQLVSDRWALELFSTTQDVGLYAALFQVGYMPIVVLTSLSTSFLAPILFQISGTATSKKINSNIHRIVWRSALICVGVALLLCVLTNYFHEIVFSFLVAEKYRSVSYLLPGVVFAGGFYSVGQMLSLKIQTNLKTSRMVVVKICTALIGVTLNIFGAYMYGVPGVVIGLIVFSLIYTVWMAILVWKNHDVIEGSE